MRLFGDPHNKDYSIWGGLNWGPPILESYHIGVRCESSVLQVATSEPNRVAKWDRVYGFRV